MKKLLLNGLTIPDIPFSQLNLWTKGLDSSFSLRDEPMLDNRVPACISLAQSGGVRRVSPERTL